MSADNQARDQGVGLRRAQERPEEKRNALPTIGPVEIFAPLPPLPYTISALGIAPGAPILLAGYGFSMKTLTAQSVALSISTGRDLWSVFRVAKGRVIHVDYEQGERLTRERYQRLAIGAGIDPRELGEDALEVAVLPTVYLDGDRAAEIFTKAFDGRALAIVDSLRASAPSLEENSSLFRGCLDVLTRASERTGCACIVVHHSRKPSEGDRHRASGGARMTVRGSSAIYDACSSVFVLGADKGGPVRVQHEKDRNRGTLVEDFGLRAEDVAHGGDVRGGLRIVHLEGDQLKASEPSKDAAANDRQRARNLGDAVACARVLITEPGLGTRAIRARLQKHLGQCGRERVEGALAYLGPALRIEPGERRAQLHFIEQSRLPKDVTEVLSP